VSICCYGELLINFSSLKVIVNMMAVGHWVLLTARFLLCSFFFARKLIKTVYFLSNNCLIRLC